MQRRLVAGAFWALLIVACASKGSGDSETHWLKCTTDLDCPSGQRCEAMHCVPRSDAGAGGRGGTGSGAGGSGASPSAGGGGAGTPETSADWKQLGYDLGSTYFNVRERKISIASAPTLEKAWEFDTGMANGTMSGTPAIVGGVVYIATQGLFALSLETGAVLWSDAEITALSSPTYDEGVLYVHDATGVLHAFSASDGTERWRFSTDGDPSLVGFSSPVVTGDYVLVGGSSLDEVSAVATFRGFVVAVNKRDGTLAWKKYTVDEGAFGASVWSTVSVDPSAGIVYAATGNNHGPPATSTSDAFLAIPLAGGASFRWTAQILAGDIWMLNPASVASPEADFGANPVVFDQGGKKLVAGGNKGGDFWVLDRMTGDVLAKRNLCPGSANEGGIFVSGAWDGARLLVACNSSPSSTLLALDPPTLDIVWAREVTGPVFSRISVAGGAGFFGNNRTLQAFDTETGQVLHEFETEGTIATAPALSNGYVVFGSGLSWTAINTTSGSKYYALRVK